MANMQEGLVVFPGTEIKQLSVQHDASSPSSTNPDRLFFVKKFLFPRQSDIVICKINKVKKESMTVNVDVVMVEKDGKCHDIKKYEFKGIMKYSCVMGKHPTICKDRPIRCQVLSEGDSGGILRLERI